MTHGLRPHDPGQKPGTAKRVLIKIKRKCQEKGPSLSVDCDSELQGVQAGGLVSGPHHLCNRDRDCSTQRPHRRWRGGGGGGVVSGSGWAGLEVGLRLCVQPCLQALFPCSKPCFPSHTAQGAGLLRSLLLTLLEKLHLDGDSGQGIWIPSHETQPRPQKADRSQVLPKRATEAGSWEERSSGMWPRCLLP